MKHSKVYKTYPGRLTRFEEKSVFKFIKVMKACDFNSIADYVKKNFDKSYNINALATLLHNMGFSYKTTLLCPSEFNKTQQKRLIETLDKKQSLSSETFVFLNNLNPIQKSQITKLLESNNEKKVPLYRLPNMPLRKDRQLCKYNKLDVFSLKFK